jgi:hypothetical protein
MKKNYLFITILAICSLLAASCDKEAVGAKYDLNNGTGFSFGSSVLNMETDSSDNDVLKIPVYRTLSSPATVDVTCQFFDSGSGTYTDSDSEGIFRLATKRVIFSDGATVGYAQVSYSDIESLGVAKKHQFKLSLSENVSTGGEQTVNVTVNRKLTFELLGTGTFYEEFLFYNTYNVQIYKAKEAAVYRVMDPFSEGLIAEDYTKNGWATTPSKYIQIENQAGNKLRFDEFANGMYFQKKYAVYGVNPSERTEFTEKDCSAYANTWVNSYTMKLYPFYYIKGYGYFDCYPMVITLPH